MKREHRHRAYWGEHSQDPKKWLLVKCTCPSRSKPEVLHCRPRWGKEESTWGLSYACMLWDVVSVLSLQWIPLQAQGCQILLDWNSKRQRWVNPRPCWSLFLPGSCQCRRTDSRHKAPWNRLCRLDTHSDCTPYSRSRAAGPPWERQHRKSLE